MAELVSQDEFDNAFLMYEEGIGKLKAAKEAKIPYHLLEWMLRQHEKDEQEREQAIQMSEFAALRTERESLSVLERMKRLQSALLTELEHRFATKAKRKEISNSALVRMLRDLRKIARGMEEGRSEVSGQMRLITHMPPKSAKVLRPPELD
ncbi:hypothetical protein MYX82_04845 [Acidobacteria bacterium AH-259-D05]|nr:hypothetical protein [Acidobacteria bacterium AH-259-D05]